MTTQLFAVQFADHRFSTAAEVLSDTQYVFATLDEARYFATDRVVEALPHLLVVFESFSWDGGPVTELTRRSGWEVLVEYSPGDEARVATVTQLELRGYDLVLL